MTGNLTVTGNVTGVVLAGGGSTRMGVDKAQLAVGGVTLLERVIRALRLAGIEDVLVVGGDPGWLRDGARFFADRYPGDGPLGGALSGAAHVSAEWIFLCSCDLVSPSSAALRGLLTYAIDEFDAVIPVDESGTRSPLHALYRTATVTAAQARFEHGERRLSALTTPPCRVLDIDVRAANDSAVGLASATELAFRELGLSLRDADTPEEWEALTRGLD